MVTAARPGKCAACTWDIIPGNKVVHLGGTGAVHFECVTIQDVPLPEPGGSQDQPERRRRIRSRA